MRLSPQHREAILRVVTETCGSSARVRLFGSRTDDVRRGGDVDLLVELPDEPERLFDLQRQLAAKLFRALDSRPVDVLIVGPHTPRASVHDEALRHGVLL